MKLNDIQSSRKHMEVEAIDQATANGLLIEATDNAKILIKAFLLSNPDLSDHKIMWEKPPAEEWYMNKVLGFVVGGIIAVIILFYLFLLITA